MLVSETVPGHRPGASPRERGTTVNLAPIDQFIVSSNEVLGGNINNFLSMVTDFVVRFL